MRCASCGTENTPDSRFCGGCGARTPGPSQVAPTVKLADDARYPTNPPTRPTPVAGMQSVPPSMPAPAPAQRPMSGPQAVQRPMSGPQAVQAPIPTPPPGRHTAPRRPVAPASEPALPVASGRRWGLVAAVLLVDLGLAGAGAYMLAESLGGGPPADAARRVVPAAAPTPAPARSSSVTAPSPAPTPGAATAAATPPAPPPAAAVVAAPAVATTVAPVAALPAATTAAALPAATPAVDTAPAPRKGASRGRPAPRRTPGTATSASGTGSAPLDPYAVDDPPPAPGTP